MTDNRDPGRKLLNDVVRFKRQRNDAIAEAARQASLVNELQLQLIAIRVRGRLLRFEDFHHHIGVQKVLERGGQVDHRKLDLLVADLLRRRPELAAPTQNVGPIGYYVDDGVGKVSGQPYDVEESPVGNTQQSSARA